VGEFVGNTQLSPGRGFPPLLPEGARAWEGVSAQTPLAGERCQRSRVTRSPGAEASLPSRCFKGFEEDLRSFCAAGKAGPCCNWCSGEGAARAVPRPEPCRVGGRAPRHAPVTATPLLASRPPPAAQRDQAVLRIISITSDD